VCLRVGRFGGLINRDVPQHVVQKILDHDSAEMIAQFPGEAAAQRRARNIVLRERAGDTNTQDNYDHPAQPMAAGHRPRTPLRGRDRRTGRGRAPAQWPGGAGPPRTPPLPAATCRCVAAPSRTNCTAASRRAATSPSRAPTPCRRPAELAGQRRSARRPMAQARPPGSARSTKCASWPRCNAPAASSRSRVTAPTTRKPSAGCARPTSRRPAARVDHLT